MHLFAMKKFWIYMIGVAVFAFFYAWLKTVVAQPIFFVAGLAYLVLVGLLAEKLGK